MRTNHRALSFFLPPLKVHSWGGVGSQLFAYLAYLRLSKMYPKRHIKFIHHTGGITRREFAIFDLVERANLQIVDDFSRREPKVGSKIPHLLRNFSLSKIIRRFIGHLLKKSKLIVELNKSPDLALFRPWTLSTRGTYSNLSISVAELKYLASHFLNLSSVDIISTNLICLHWRLDDLLNLTEKQPISPHRIQFTLNRCRAEIGLSEPIKLEVMSDSPERALTEIRVFPETSDVEIITLNSYDFRRDIKRAIGAAYFIGTNSKISIWIILFRLVFNPSGKNNLCYELESNLDNLLSRAHPSSLIKFY